MNNFQTYYGGYCKVLKLRKILWNTKGAGGNQGLRRVYVRTRRITYDYSTF